MSFEKAYARLEDILKHLASGELPLEEALKLYEEADRLISECQKKLADAEKRVEILIKNREGELQINHAGQPEVDVFDVTSEV